MATRAHPALSLLIAGLVSASAAGGDDPSLEVIAAWGGPVNAVQLDGSLAVLGSGRRLVNLDVTNLNNFIELGSVVFDYPVQDVALRDDLAFVLTRSQPNIFNVVDVSTPAAPKVLWSSEAANEWSLSYARKLMLHGDYAYILEFHEDLQVVNVANPLSPVGPGVAILIKQASVRLSDFVIANDLLYVASGYSEQPKEAYQVPSLRIYDLAAAPVNPPLLSTLEIDLPDHKGEMLFITVVGNYVYALVLHESLSGGGTFLNLAVIDVSSPRTPKLVTPAAATFSNTYKHGLSAANGRLFVAAGSDPSVPTADGWSASEGLIIYDIAANPAAPALLDTYKTHGSIYEVNAVGNTAWLSDTGEGLIALDVTNPTNPIRKDNLHSPAFLTGLDKRDDLLFISDLWNGFTILNVADAAAPQVVGVYQTPKTPPPFGKGELTNNGIFNTDIAVRDNLAYLAAGWAGIHAVNISNPANPLKAGAATLPEGQRATAIELDGNVAHMGVRFGPVGFYNNYDISDTSLPSIVMPLLGSVQIAGGPHTIATRQGFSYLAMGNGLTVIDTTAPADPMLISESLTPYALDLAITGDLLYVADGLKGPPDPGGLKIYSLAQRNAPAAIDGGYYPGYHTSAVALQGQHAYALGLFGEGGYGCLALDVADPSQPQALAYQPNVGLHVNNALLADEPHIFAATGDGDRFWDKGLAVLRIDGLPPDEPLDPADLNQDGLVNGFDLALLLSQWTGSAFYSSCPPHIPADLSHDCRVNGADIAMLLAAWG